MATADVRTSLKPTSSTEKDGRASRRTHRDDAGTSRGAGQATQSHYSLTDKLLHHQSKLAQALTGIVSNSDEQDNALQALTASALLGKIVDGAVAADNRILLSDGAKQPSLPHADSGWYWSVM